MANARSFRSSLLLVMALVAGCSFITFSHGEAFSHGESAPSTGSGPAAADTPAAVVFLPVISNLAGPSISGCPVFPPDNIWNTPVNTLPVQASSDLYVNSIGIGRFAHADFGSGEWPPGSGAPIGIPYITVPGSQAPVTIHFTAYGSESDPGPYPVPGNAPIEGGPNSTGDRHVLVIDQGACKLYELYRAFPQSDGSWNADSGAIFDLKANGPLRTAGFTSADAAGLPIFPGLVRFEEVAAGEIRHAIRFTVPCTQAAYAWPARHQAGSCGTSYPAMGQRFRLKASFDISGAPPQSKIVLTALKKYGMVVTDNGSAWYLSGAPNAGWDNTDLHWLDSHVSGAAFEAVDATALMVSSGSGQARQP